MIRHQFTENNIVQKTSLSPNMILFSGGVNNSLTSGKWPGGPLRSSAAGSRLQSCKTLKTSSWRLSIGEIRVKEFAYWVRFLEEQAILPNQVILIQICSTNRKSCLQISDCVIDMIVSVQRDFSKNGNFSALLRTVLYSALSYSGCAQDDQYMASCAPGVATHHWPPQSCWCSAVDDDSDNILIIWENNQHVVQAVWRRFGGGRPERGMAKSRSVADIHTAGCKTDASDPLQCTDENVQKYSYGVMFLVEWSHWRQAVCQCRNIQPPSLWHPTTPTPTQKVWFKTKFTRVYLADRKTKIIICLTIVTLHWLSAKGKVVSVLLSKLCKWKDLLLKLTMIHVFITILLPAVSPLPPGQASDGQSTPPLSCQTPEQKHYQQ